MITGFDYIFISNLVPEKVELEVVKMFKDLWGKPIIDFDERQPDHLELFIAKNKQMHLHQDEHGFTLDKNGEGCVMFCARLFPLFQGDVEVISCKEPEGLRDIAPYTSNISLINVWEYTMVLPGDIEESPFCKSIYNRFLSILEGK